MRFEILKSINKLALLNSSKGRAILQAYKIKLYDLEEKLVTEEKVFSFYEPGKGKYTFSYEIIDNMFAQYELKYDNPEHNPKHGGGWSSNGAYFEEVTGKAVLDASRITKDKGYHISTQLLVSAIIDKLPPEYVIVHISAEQGYVEEYTIVTAEDAKAYDLEVICK